MCLLFSEIVINLGQLMFTGAGVCIAVFVFVWNFNRARKGDFEKAMKGKADIEVVRREFTIRDERLKSVEALQHQQNEFVREKIEEVNTTLENG